jgi:hypothetical protein
MKEFLPPTEKPKTDDARIVDLPSSPEISYNEYDADDVSNDSSDLGGAECKPPVGMQQTEFCLKQFANRMGQANNSAFNK